MPHRVIPILRNNLRQPLKGSLQVLLSEIEDIAHVPVVGNPVYDSPAILALVDYAHFRDMQGISVEEIGIVRCEDKLGIVPIVFPVLEQTDQFPEDKGVYGFVQPVHNEHATGFQDKERHADKPCDNLRTLGFIPLQIKGYFPAVSVAMKDIDPVLQGIVRIARVLSMTRAIQLHVHKVETEFLQER